MLFFKNLSTFLLQSPLSSPKPLLHLSTAADPTQFVIDYLTTSIGLSLHRALKASPSLTRVRSPQNFDSVLSFLLSNGFTRAHIKSLISWNPKILAANVDKTLVPRSEAMKEAGFDGPVLVRIIRSNPIIFHLKDVVPRLRFWRSFFHHSEKEMLNAFQRNRNLLGYDIDKAIMPRIQLLESFGFSSGDIAAIITRVDWFLLRKPDAIKELIGRTRELFGFNPCDDGGMFVQGLSVVGMLKRDTLERKFMLFKSMGWSEEEVLDAFRKNPKFVTLSEENVRRTLNFLVGEAGCDTSLIVRRPMLLSYSLEKRLVPRNVVFKELKAKGLGKRDWKFGSVVMVPEDIFLKKFILPYEEAVPGLYKNYLDVCEGNVARKT